MRKDYRYAARGDAVEHVGDGGGDRDGAGVVVREAGRGTIDEGRGSRRQGEAGERCFAPTGRLRQGTAELTREELDMLCELVQMRMNGLYSLVAIGDGHAVRQYEMLGMCLAALDGQG